MEIGKGRESVGTLLFFFTLSLPFAPGTMIVFQLLSLETDEVSE